MPLIGAVNGARVPLRGKLLRGLFSILELFGEASCECSAKSLKSYVVSLIKIGMWPLDICWKKSVQSCLDSTGLKKFYPEIPAGSCKTCVKILDGNRAREVRNKVQKDFHGLCLDCMDLTRVTTSMDGDTGGEDGDRGTNGMSVSDRAYWEYDRMGGWGSRCWVKHGHPTWYFSYMGRKSDM